MKYLVLMFLPIMAFATCNDQANTISVKKCLDKQYSSSQKKMEKLIRLFKHKLNISEKLNLINAQKSWMIFRDKDCKFSGYHARGGTLEGVLILQCYIDLTDQRINNLQSYMQSLGE